jgi:hypothetical protein
MFGIFIGKGTPNGKSGKSYLLNNLSTHPSKQIFVSKFFLEMLSLGDSQFG